MEFTPSVFNTYCHQNLIRIRPIDFQEEVDNYELTPKVKRQVVVLSNLIRKYTPNDILNRPFPKDSRVAFLLMCIISNYRINNHKVIQNADIELMNQLENKVHDYNLQEDDYLQFCSNLKTHTIITDFYENVCYCCSTSYMNDGNLRVHALK